MLSGAILAQYLPEVRGMRSPCRRARQLFGQAHGFQGRRRIDIRAHTRDLSVVNPKDPRHAHIEFGSALASAVPQGSDTEHPIGAAPYLLCFECELPAVSTIRLNNFGPCAAGCTRFRVGPLAATGPGGQELARLRKHQKGPAKAKRQRAAYLADFALSNPRSHAAWVKQSDDAKSAGYRPGQRSDPRNY